MTDTTTEAVDRLIQGDMKELVLSEGVSTGPEDTQAVYRAVAMLRALAAERDALRAQLVTAQAQAQAARDALKWYAAEVADCRKIISDGIGARAKLDRDGGHRARTVLANWRD